MHPWCICIIRVTKEFQEPVNYKGPEVRVNEEKQQNEEKRQLEQEKWRRDETRGGHAVNDSE